MICAWLRCSLNSHTKATIMKTTRQNYTRHQCHSPKPVSVVHLSPSIFLLASHLLSSVSRSLNQFLLSRPINSDIKKCDRITKVGDAKNLAALWTVVVPIQNQPILGFHHALSTHLRPKIKFTGLFGMSVNCKRVHKLWSTTGKNFALRNKLQLVQNAHSPISLINLLYSFSWINLNAHKNKNNVLKIKQISPINQ